ncbi:hypothetical protein CVT26_003614 [Gymnopilus dilepis]|uniref:Uncharacterized protein n=1 Tax=Gymnopilus dilepis TaxID=231916 RepID=A0A409WR53_9AGAR|nr:hypothetical protein CVT26_003614 [Gymnopilus dilepis]
MNTFDTNSYFPGIDVQFWLDCGFDEKYFEGFDIPESATYDDLVPADQIALAIIDAIRRAHPDGDNRRQPDGQSAAPSGAPPVQGSLVSGHEYDHRHPATSSTQQDSGSLSSLSSPAMGTGLDYLEAPFDRREGPNVQVQSSDDMSSTCQSSHPCSLYPAMDTRPAAPAPSNYSIPGQVRTGPPRHSMQPPRPPTRRGREEVPSPSRIPVPHQAWETKDVPSTVQTRSGNHTHDAGSQGFTRRPGENAQCPISSPAPTTTDSHRAYPVPAQTARQTMEQQDGSASHLRETEPTNTNISARASEAGKVASSEEHLIERQGSNEDQCGRRSRQQDGQEGFGIAAQPGPSTTPSDANTRPARASLDVQPAKKGTKRRKDAIEDPAESSSSSAPRALKRARIDNTSPLPASPPSQLTPSSSSSSSSSQSRSSSSSSSSTPSVRNRPQPATYRRGILKDRIAGNIVISTDIRAQEEENREWIWVQESGLEIRKRTSQHRCHSVQQPSQAGTDQHGSNPLLAVPAPPTLVFQEQYTTASQHQPMATRPLAAYQATPAAPYNATSDQVLTGQPHYSMQPSPPPTRRGREEVPVPEQAWQHKGTPSTVQSNCSVSTPTATSEAQYQSMTPSRGHTHDAGSQGLTRHPVENAQYTPPASADRCG